tara:strand:- start:740 stop:1210 length:471 start_codon:yes stop_codon:yes gene_type:complete
MDINAIIIKAADASHAVAKADRLGKSHAEDKKAATQIIFECVKAANVEHGMTPGAFRVQFSIEAGYSCREYDVDGKLLAEHEGEKMPQTAQSIISSCGRYYKEFKTFDNANCIADIRNAFKIEKTKLDKAFKAFDDLDHDDQRVFIQKMNEQAMAA